MLFEAWEPLLELVHQPPGVALGLGDGEFAELGAGAGNGPPPERRTVSWQPGRFPLAPLAADGAHAIALSVDAPPAEVRGEPLWRDGLIAFPGETLDFRKTPPRILLPLEALQPLRLCLLDL